MTTLVHSFCSRHVLCVDHNQFETVGALKAYLTETKGFPTDALFFICNGCIVEDCEPVKKDVVYHTYPRILGGKGGFGSMLRSIGAQIEKTTNHEALRDLSGRRMRDVNNEIASPESNDPSIANTRLKEWLAKQSDKEREREQRRQERLARRRAMPNHKFDDPLYDQQRNLLAESQEQALLEGLKKSQTASSTSSSSDCQKRKSDEPMAGSSKQRKTTEWLGIDIDNLSDLDSDEEKDDTSDNSNLGTSEAGRSSDNTSEGSSVKIPVTDSGENVSNSNEESAIGAGVHTEDVEEITGEKQDSLSKAEETNKETCTGEVTPQTQEAEKKEEKEENTGPIELDNVSSIAELLKYGLDPLKQELMRRGLKCGGTLEQRAERLFSVKGLTQEEIDPSLFAKNGGKNLKKKT